MRGTAISVASAGALTATFALSSLARATAQESEAGGMRFTFGFQTELRAHDNLNLDPVTEGVTVRSDTRLSFDFLSETPVTTLSLEADTVLRAERMPNGEIATDVVNPSFGLEFVREGANARFTFDASYQLSEIDVFEAVFDEDLDEVDLISDTGTRNLYSVGTTLETGLNAPLGFLLGLEHSGTFYTGTSDPGLVDSTTTEGFVEATLRFSPVTTGQARASAEHYEADDAAGTVRDIYAATLGLTHEFSQITVVDVSLGGRHIDDSVNGTSQGLEGRLALSRELPRGAFSFSLESEETLAGRRDRVELERSFDFPRGTVTIALGAVDAEGIDPQPVGRLDWRYELYRGAVTAGLSHDVSVNSDADLQRTTRALLGVAFDLTPVSSVAFNIDYAAISAAGTGGVSDTARGSFGATYNRALTEDWTFSAGYEARYLDETGSGPAWDNALFVKLGRTFTYWR